MKEQLKADQEYIPVQGILQDLLDVYMKRLHAASSTGNKPEFYRTLACVAAISPASYDAFLKSRKK